MFFARWWEIHMPQTLDVNYNLQETLKIYGNNAIQMKTLCFCSMIVFIAKLYKIHQIKICVCVCEFVCMYICESVWERENVYVWVCVGGCACVRECIWNNWYFFFFFFFCANNTSIFTMNRSLSYIFAMTCYYISDSLSR